MRNNWIFKILLFPFSMIFALIISMRNIFYETGLLKATSFSIPVINVGNLSVGGTGKTPHIEYLIELLSPYITVGTLSRGYKRKSKGFRLVRPNDDALVAGDEPLQFKTKYPHVPVAVSESRNIGIPLLIKHHYNLQCVLLDDAFQHRSVVPGLNILLTEHDNLFVDDWLLPSGRLREPISSYERADIIVVTKCPDELSSDSKFDIRSRIKPFKHQKLLFSKYEYGNPYFILDKSIQLAGGQLNKVVLISAIANVDYLLRHLEENFDVVNVIKYEDHHYFSEFEIEQFKKIIEENKKQNLVLMTTEKDAMRLRLFREYILANRIPIFVLPISVRFLDDGAYIFDDAIRSFLLNFKI